MIFAVAGGGLLPVILLLLVGAVFIWFGERKTAFAIAGALLVWEGAKAVIAML